MRFSIRDLLWATLVVALCAGWWTDHKRMERRQGDIQEMVDWMVEQDAARLSAEQRQTPQLVPAMPATH